MRTKTGSYSSDEQMRTARIAQVAWLYYLQGQKQQAIADRVGVSRTAVSRMIGEAREKNIVAFDIQYPWRDQTLEKDLLDHFHLEEAIVVVSTEEKLSPILDSIGMAASQWLSRNITSVSRISVSWGLSLRAMIDAIPPSRNSDLTIIQAIGATGTESNASASPLLAQNLAEKLGAQLQLLHAPLLVDNESVRDALLRDRHISAVLESAMQADIAFVGVGLPSPRENNLVRTGYMTDDQARDLVSIGAVGDICARYFDNSGKLLEIDHNRRVMGVSPTEMTKIRKVVGVSGGPLKGPAVLSALRGEYLDVLVTDRTAAEYVLSH